MTLAILLIFSHLCARVCNRIVPRTRGVHRCHCSLSGVLHRHVVSGRASVSATFLHVFACAIAHSLSTVQGSLRVLADLRRVGAWLGGRGICDARLVFLAVTAAATSIQRHLPDIQRQQHNVQRHAGRHKHCEYGDEESDDRFSPRANMAMVATTLHVSVFSKTYPRFGFVCQQRKIIRK